MEGQGKSSIDIKYVASLARLKLSPEAERKLQREMEMVLEYVNTLSALDVSGIEPTAHASPMRNVWREDRAEPSFPREEMLAAAPETVDEKLIKVPPVLPGEEEP